MAIKIHYVKALKDNFVWLLIHNNNVIVIDPGEAQPVLNWLSETSYNLVGIAITHHHFDHIGGILELRQHYPQCTLMAPDHPDISDIDQKPSENKPFHFWKHQSIFVPGHTATHVAYYDGTNVFTGDTLFSGGCGRNFECDYVILFESINKIAELPDKTLLFCGHEYTQQNLKFAQTIEPNNHFITDQYNQNLTKEATLPTTLGLEKKINPFLRTSQKDIIAAVEQKFKTRSPSPEQVFRFLREWKNNWS